jgi:hypothetical protein
MMSGSALQIHARLLTDPPMWAVEVRDTATHEILWSSWTDEWTAYQTVDQAVRRADEIVARLLTPDRARVA